MEPVDEGANATVKATVDGNGTRIIAIAGELDISNVSAIEAELSPLVSNGASTTIFDLSSLTFMDSSGIAMLLRTAERTGPVTIRKPSRIVQQIIEAGGLAEILHIEE